MTTVLLAGDWHGNTLWAQSRIMDAQHLGIDRIYHLGDFGVWPGERGRAYLDKIERTCKHAGIELWVTPGNHEDYTQIQGGGDLQWIRPHVALIPRGFRWEQEGRSFVSLGGAPSIDREGRQPYVSWWPEEMITLREAEAVAAAGHADIMLAHDCPNNATYTVQAIIDTPPHASGWSEFALRYAKEGRELMDIAFNGVRPQLFAHGHYHVNDAAYRNGTWFVALACDGMRGNTAKLDLSDLSVTMIDEFK